MLTKKASLEEALQQLRDALEVLSEVNADQTGGGEWDRHTSQDHLQYMAGVSASQLKTTVRTALAAASSLAGDRQRPKIESFLQDPFTGTYAAHAGEVVGILNSTHATFKANLAGAGAAEEAAIKAYQKFMRHTNKDLDDWRARQTQAKGELASNDNELSSSRTQHQMAVDDLDNAQTFLASLLDMCSAKTKQYNERVALRRKEETAIAEAISILNSDEAFATFGTINATRIGATSLVQLRAIHNHEVQPIEGSTKKVQAFLQRKAEKQHSPMLGRIVTLLQTKNPFAVVLAEIDKMLDLIAAEERADDEQQQWCDQERSETDQAISDKSDQISDLNGAIDSLKNQIDHPQDGLVAQQEATEIAIEDNHESQVKETEQRREETDAYEENIQNLVNCQALLKRAVVVLRNYYSKISSEISPALLQGQDPRTPDPPSTWDDKYTGQSGDGSSVIDMLEFILTNTKQEETEAHDDELSAQVSYEDSMHGLKDEMENLQTTLGTIQATLAQRRQELKTKKKEHDVTSKEKATLEAYLEKIKPGCDYITNNIAARKANRAEETESLEEAKQLLEESPAHAEAEARAHQESLGDCAGICNSQGEEHVDCKACLAKVSVPGYCAGHPGTDGC